VAGSTRSDSTLPFPRDGSIPPRLFKAIARATRKLPEERYPTIGEFASELRAWRGEAAPPPAEPSEGPDVDDDPRPTLDAAIRERFGEGT